MAWPLGVVALDLALTVFVFAQAWFASNPSFVGYPGDPQQTMWFWAWFQHALSSGVNPFVTHAMNAPDGVNLMWNTMSPLLALIAWPVEGLFGPVAAYNTVLTLTVAGSASGATLACRHFGASRLASTIGGLLYGFSPFVMAHAYGHADLASAVTAPLLLVVLDDVLVRRRHSRRRNIAALTALTVAQFFISEEVLLIEAVVAAMAAVLLACTKPRRAREHARSALPTVGPAAIIAGVVVAWPLWLQFAGPQRVTGTIQGLDLYTTDVLNPLIPTNVQALAPPIATSVSSHFIGYGAEATGYLGVPLIALLCFLVVRRFRDPWVRTLAILAMGCGILSLGGHPHVRGHIFQSVPLPWWPAEQLPVLRNILPGRFMEITFLLVAVLTAQAVDVLMWTRPLQSMRRGAGVLLLAATAVTFAPATPLPATTDVTPAFFRGDAARLDGRTVLLAPIPDRLQIEPMMWHAEAGLAFPIIGGYFIGPDVTAFPSTRAILATAGTSTTVPEATVAAMREELKNADLHTVVLGPSPVIGQLEGILARACGDAPVTDQGVLVWWGTCAN